MRHSKLLSVLQNLINRVPKQREFAEALSYPINTIGNRAVRDSEYSDEEIFKIQNYYGVDILGTVYGKPETKKNSNITQINNDNEIVGVSYGEQVAVDYYPDVFGSCGNGSFALSEIKEKISIPRTLFTFYSKNKQYSIINAYGNSMHPYIQDKDLLLIEHSSGEPIIDNRVYIFRYNDSLYVKRLVKNITQLVVISDNTEYDTIKLNLTEDPDIEIIGKVILVLRKAD